jgi:hypothetical protein
MDDTELDRTLKSALSVSPSPEFVAHVRQRIAESQAAPFSGGWLKIAAASVSGIAIVTAIGFRSSVIEISPALPSLDSRAIASYAEEPSLPQPALHRVSAQSRPGHPQQRASSFSEVLIDPAQLRAIHDLVVAARERRFEVIFSDRPPSAPLSTTDLAVAPLEIVPLNSPVHVNN